MIRKIHKSILILIFGLPIALIVCISAFIDYNIRLLIEILDSMTKGMKLK